MALVQIKIDPKERVKIEEIKKILELQLGIEIPIWAIIRISLNNIDFGDLLHNGQIEEAFRKLKIKK